MCGNPESVGVAWGRGNSAIKAGALGIFRPSLTDTLSFLFRVGSLCVHQFYGSDDTQFMKDSSDDSLWPSGEGAASLP